MQTLLVSSNQMTMPWIRTLAARNLESLRPTVATTFVTSYVGLDVEGGDAKSFARKRGDSAIRAPRS
jgi:hypothetical protein